MTRAEFWSLIDRLAEAKVAVFDAERHVMEIQNKLASEIALKYPLHAKEGGE